MTRPSRRKFLKIASLGSASVAVAGYSAFRGLRLPPLRWEPRPPVNSLQLDNLEVSATDCIFLGSSRENPKSISIRAYAPEPILDLVSARDQTIEVTVNNVAADAVLELSSNLNSSSIVKQSMVGINRTLTLSLSKGMACQLKWTLPQLGEYSFAAIGDSGGADELEWCIKRAHTLGARFLLHLGDFNYQAGDYKDAIKHFHNAPIPCYVCIGNHDFHDNGAVYQPFLNSLGPLNHYFSIGQTRFVNFDTASDFIPYGSGQRGRLFEQLIADNSPISDSVAFSHRPIYDPVFEEEGEHNIGSDGERDWLIASLKKAGIKTLLSGHIHIFDRRTTQGIDNIIAGQGLGHQDLITNSDYSKIALGHVNTQGLVSIEAANLAMPMELHCHPRSDYVKKSLTAPEYAEMLETIQTSCNRE